MAKIFGCRKFLIIAFKSCVWPYWMTNIIPVNINVLIFIYYKCIINVFSYSGEYICWTKVLGPRFKKKNELALFHISVNLWKVLCAESNRKAYYQANNALFRISYIDYSLKNKGGNYVPKWRKSGDILNGKYMQRNYNCKFTEQIINEKKGSYYNIILIGSI